MASDVVEILCSRRELNCTFLDHLL